MAARTNQAPTKKLGLESSATRAALLDATEELIREEGFAAITSRILAAKAGLKPQLIHYYFNSMDDLYVEVVRRGAEADLARLTAALDMDQPLRALWRLASDPRSSRFVTEFMALANHSDAVRAEITKYAIKMREVEAEIVSRHLSARGVTPRVSPLAIAVMAETVARGMALESSLDISLGHDEVEAFFDACLRRFEETGGARADADALLGQEGVKPVGPKKTAKRPPKRAASRRR